MRYYKTSRAKEKPRDKVQKSKERILLRCPITNGTHSRI